jgi:hypothetical protein
MEEARWQPEYSVQHLVHDLLTQRRAGVVIDAICPKNNLNVHISNDLLRACAQEPTFIRIDRNFGSDSIEECASSALRTYAARGTRRRKRRFR